MSILIVMILGAFVDSMYSVLTTLAWWIYCKIKHNRPYPVHKNRVKIY